MTSCIVFSFSLVIIKCEITHKLHPYPVCGRLALGRRPWRDSRRLPHGCWQRQLPPLPRKGCALRQPLPPTCERQPSDVMHSVGRVRRQSGDLWPVEEEGLQLLLPRQPLPLPLLR